MRIPNIAPVHVFPFPNILSEKSSRLKSIGGLNLIVRESSAAMFAAYAGIKK